MKENSDLILKLSLPIFILLGFANITAYYGQFHFPILEYLSFPEIITIFLGSIFIYTGLFFHFAILFFLDKKHFRGSLTIILLAYLLISAFNIISGNFRVRPSSDILTVITVIFIVSFLIIYVSKKSFFTYLSTLDQIKKKLILSGFMLLFILVIASFQGKFEADFVKKNHIYSGTAIVQGINTIVSNDTTYFIGKTNDYIFFYNQQSDNVDIYRVSELERIRYKIKKTY